MKKETVEKIREILLDCVTGAIKRSNDSHSKSKAFRPFHTALLSESIVKISSFERSFSTSFGQGPIEKISELVAQDNGFETQRQKTTRINAYKGAIDEVERICSALRGGGNTPNWKNEVEVISSFNKGDVVSRRIISDLWLKKNGVESFISIKTVKPNLDQSEIAKKDMLLLKSDNEKNNPYFALYYNPFGESRSDYSHSFPKKIFNMQNDKCVLIGRDYWEFLGGEGTYEEVLEVFSLVGTETKKMLMDI